MNGWTVSQWEAVRWAVLGLKRKEIARHLKIAHQNVTKRILAAGWLHVDFAFSAISASRANADAAAIDSGQGDDNIINHGGLTATSTASSTGVEVEFAAIGADVLPSAWDGSTAGNALARAIAAGDGRDRMTNDAAIQATSNSTTTSVVVSVTGIGMSSAAVASRSTAKATGLDGGAEADEILNEAEVRSTATAEASGVSLTFTIAGAATGSSLDNTTNAESAAIGLAGVAATT